jgi:hypothetical protein
MSASTLKFLELQWESAKVCGMPAAAAFYAEAIECVRAIEKIERTRRTPLPTTVSGLDGGPSWLVGPPPRWHRRFVDAVADMKDKA